MIARTPAPLYYAVIFTSLRSETDPAGAQGGARGEGCIQPHIASQRHSHQIANPA